MDQILKTVGELLLRAVPTVVIVVFLHFLLKSMVFGPLKKTLADREALTAGAVARAVASSKAADEKAASLEAALRNAKAELYKEQEATRRQWLDDQAGQLKVARDKADGLITSAKSDLASETETARTALIAQSEALADQIVKSLLETRS